MKGDKWFDLRYFGILFLIALAGAGTIALAVTLAPNLAPLWAILLAFGCLSLFPFALWLDRKMRR